jgi:hypothetical protein
MICIFMYMETIYQICIKDTLEILTLYDNHISKTCIKHNSICQICADNILQYNNSSK